MSEPFIIGLHDTTFIFRFSAVYRREPQLWFFSAKAYGIMIFIYG